MMTDAVAPAIWISKRPLSQQKLDLEHQQPTTTMLFLPAYTSKLHLHSCISSPLHCSIILTRTTPYTIRPNYSPTLLMPSSHPTNHQTPAVRLCSTPNHNQLKFETLRHFSHVLYIFQLEQPLKSLLPAQSLPAYGSTSPTSALRYAIRASPPSVCTRTYCLFTTLQTSTAPYFSHPKGATSSVADTHINPL